MTTPEVDEVLPRRETATDLKVSRSGDAAKFWATMTDDRYEQNHYGLFASRR